MAPIPMKNQASQDRQSQAGNIFLIIFLAIAMFAGLTFALSQGMRSGQSSLTKEKANLAATQVIDFLNKVKQAVDALIINGCDPLKIDFTNGVYEKNNGTALETAPAGTTANCKVFDPSGGAISAVDFTEYVGIDYPTAPATDPKAGSAAARYVDSGLGTTENDLAYGFYFIHPDVCLAILNKTNSGSAVYEEIIEDDYDEGGANSYTPGTAGTLDALTVPTSSRIWAVKEDSNNAYCNAGIILRAY